VEHCLTDLLGLLARQTRRDRRLGEGQRKLDGLGLRGREIESPCDARVERGSTPVEDARELAGATVRDREGRPVVTDADDDESRGSGLGPVLRGGSERAKDRERLQVDPREPDAGLLAGGGVTVDEVAVGDDEVGRDDRLAAAPPSGLDDPVQPASTRLAASGRRERRVARLIRAAP